MDEKMICQSCKSQLISTFAAFHVATLASQSQRLVGCDEQLDNWRQLGALVGVLDVESLENLSDNFALVKQPHRPTRAPLTLIKSR